MNKRIINGKPVKKFKSFKSASLQFEIIEHSERQNIKVVDWKSYHQEYISH